MNKVLKFYDYDKALAFYEDAFLHIRQAYIKRSGFKVVAKPILLLAVLKAIDDGLITINRFTYDQIEPRYCTFQKLLHTSPSRDAHFNVLPLVLHEPR